jgi:hypothetical protein
MNRQTKIPSFEYIKRFFFETHIRSPPRLDKGQSP